MSSEHTQQDLYDSIIACNKMIEDIHAIIVKIKNECQCTTEFLEKKSYYFSGSYNDTAYTEYWTECKICGKKYDKENQNHGWYG